MTDIIGEMYGERAVNAPFAFVISNNNRNGLKSTKLGGVILADMDAPTSWVRWRGTAIIIPTAIDIPRNPCGHRIDQMLAGPLGQDQTEDEINDPESFWKPVWRKL